jgi:protein MpaA
MRFTQGLLVMSFVILSGCADQPDEQFETPAVPPSPVRVTAVPPPAPVQMPTSEVVSQIGTTTEQKPILMHVFGSSMHPVLVMGGIHGNERNSSECASLLLEMVKQNPQQFRGISLAIIPAANPDGLERGVRVNARRVDLNRNFPARNWEASKFKGPYFGGPSAASEPETTALVNAITRLQPSRILTIHSMPQPCNNYDGPGENLATRMAALNGYAVAANIGYPTPGSLGSWAGIDRNIPVITLELPGRMPGAQCWEHNRQAILTFIQG